MNRRALFVVIPLLVVLGNAVAYFAIIRSRPGQKAAPEQTPVAEPTPAPAEVSPKAPSAPPPSHETSDQSLEAAALARRSAGLVALEAGEYDKALIQFTEAQALVGDKARVADLIRVTQDLRSKSSGGATAPRPRPSAPARSSRIASRRAEPREEPPPAIETEPAPQPAGGTLIVTTSPRGLLVQVDDSPLDLTPMRTRLKSGSHRVALLDGGRRVYETTLEIKDGATATLLKDFPSEASPEPARPSAAAVESREVAQEAARTETVAKSTGTARPAPASSATPASAAATPAESPAGSGGTGSLDISSPGLYGVVWVNGRPRGYPPLKVQDVPVGPAKVEVRVNGVQKRVSSIVVQPGLTQAVQLGAQP